MCGRKQKKNTKYEGAARQWEMWGVNKNGAREDGESRGGVVTYLGRNRCCVSYILY